MPFYYDHDIQYNNSIISDMEDEDSFLSMDDVFDQKVISIPDEPSYVPSFNSLVEPSTASMEGRGNCSLTAQDIDEIFQGNDCSDLKVIEENPVSLEDSNQFSNIIMQYLLNGTTIESPTATSVTSNTCSDQIILSTPSSPSSSSNSSSSSRSSKFEKSSFTKKTERKTKKGGEKAEKRQRKKAATPATWDHTKFSGSASYLEVPQSQIADGKRSLTIEVATTPRRQNGPLASDRALISELGELAIYVGNLDANKEFNYVSLKGIIDKKTFYGEEKSSKVYTWIRIQGTLDWMFLYCQTGKVDNVHNVITITHDNQFATRSENLSKHSGKCSAFVSNFEFIPRP